MNVLSNMLLGRYIPGNSFIHQMDPRAKIISVLFFMVIVFFANHWLGYLLLILFMLSVIRIAQINIFFLFNGLKLLFFILIFTFLLHIFFTSGGTTLFEWGFIQIDSEGVITGIYITIRLVMLLIITTILTLTTSPIELTDAIENLGAPLKKIKVPMHELAMMISISLRFIPTLMDETEKIIKAQSARGSTFMTGKLKSRVNALIPIFIPLFISAFKRAEEMAVAMEVRGYKGEEGRTSYRELKWGLKDTSAIVIIILFGVMLFLVRM